MERTREEGEEENEGRTAVTEERDEQNMLYQQALTVNNQTTEETRTGIGTEPLQRETEDPAPELKGLERYLNISLGVIAYSATMLVAYHSVASNKLTSVRMSLYEASIWLLYLTFIFGGIMLAIAIRRPFTDNLRTIYNCLLCLAAVTGTYALGFEAYLLLPESTISLVIICVTPIALLLVAMIPFKDKIVRLFRF